MWRGFIYIKVKEIRAGEELEWSEDVNPFEKTV